MSRGCEKEEFYFGVSGGNCDVLVLSRNSLQVDVSSSLLSNSSPPLRSSLFSNANPSVAALALQSLLCFTVSTPGTATLVGAFLAHILLPFSLFPSAAAGVA